MIIPKLSHTETMEEEKHADATTILLFANTGIFFLKKSFTLVCSKQKTLRVYHALSLSP